MFGWWKHVENRPRARLFAILSLLWLFPSFGALWIVAIHWNVWAEPVGLLSKIEATRLEQWIALGLLGLHALFVVLAFRLGRSEDAPS